MKLLPKRVVIAMKIKQRLTGKRPNRQHLADEYRVIAAFDCLLDPAFEMRETRVDQGDSCLAGNPVGTLKPAFWFDREFHREVPLLIAQYVDGEL